jgi:hypothetical protein
MVLMFGRMGSSKQPLQTGRFEEAMKLSKPFGPVQASFSTEWINDDFGVNQTPELDLKSYQLNLSVDAHPVQVNLEAGFSHLLSGLYNIGSAANPAGIPTNTALEAPAGQAQISYYPFNFFYTAISDSFANFNSKVAMSGVNFQQYGVYPGASFSASSFLDAYGLIGEVDTLESDRYGWRFNIGWKGREQDWMKSWPSFLDDVIVNFDVASKNEYRAFYSPEGYNVVEAFNMLTPFYQEDEGIWGLALWGGYATPPWAPARQSYDTGIENIRNDGNASGDETRYQFTLSSERVPLMLPIYNNGGTLSLTPATAGQAPALDGGGHNQYAILSDLKSYNYITLTTKFQLNKMFGFDRALYASFFFTDNSVAGNTSNAVTNLTGNSPTSANPSTFSANIPNLFDQSIYNFGIMYQILHDVDVQTGYGWETWKSSYTYPLIDYRTDVIQLGFGYDIPWGGGKFELRYKDVNFQDTYVPANNYHVGQWLSELYLYF